MLSQLQLYGIILYTEPAVPTTSSLPATQFRHYTMQNTDPSEQMNALNCVAKSSSRQCYCTDLNKRVGTLLSCCTVLPPSSSRE